MQEHKSRPWTNLSESHADRFGRVFRRGEIYWVGLGEKDLETHAQGGRRPCLIIQNDIGNHFSDTIIVLPLTGKEKPVCRYCCMKCKMHTVVGAGIGCELIKNQAS